MFNECPVDAWVERATRVGFNLVMLADAGASHTDLTRRVADLVRLAIPRGGRGSRVGRVALGVAGHAAADSSVTDPDQAAAFVRETGIDLLAVSVGNVHVLVSGQRDLNMAHLAAIRQKVNIPLALHGGSGIAADSLAKAVAAGVAKVNFGTYLKQRYLAAVRQAIAAAGTDPHQSLGYGGDADLLVAVRRAVRDAVLERIGLLGCCGKV